ncbi:MAG: hypothetical protein QW379_00770 [Thermoplasmata archaeon]
MNLEALVPAALLLSQLGGLMGFEPATPEALVASPEMLGLWNARFPPSGLLPLFSPGGRGILLDFDIVSERNTYEANVSDPTKPSAFLTVTVRNNGTSPGSVRLAATINLGGSVELNPTRTGLLLPQESSSVAVKVFLPPETSSSLVASLRIDAQCEQNPAVTDFLLISLTIRQWHGIRLENVTLSSNSPVEREVVQLTAMVRNTGNGGSFFGARASIDGRPLRVIVEGRSLDENSTVRLEAGRFLLVTVRWVASLGEHNFVIEAWDAGPEAWGNLSTAIVRDSRVVHVSVGVNYRDWIPYLSAITLALVLAGALVLRYRKGFRSFLEERRRRPQRRVRPHPLTKRRTIRL